MDRVHHLHAIDHTAEDGVSAVEFRQGTQGHIELGAGGIRSLGAGHGHRSTLMGQLQAIKFRRIGAHPAVAGLRLGSELDLKRDHPRLAVVGIHKTAGTELPQGNRPITGLRIAPLHHKGNGLANNAVEHGSVVGAAPHQIDEIAGGEGSGIAVHFNRELALARLHGDGGQALQAGRLSISTTGHHRSARGRAATHQQRDEQQQRPGTKTTHRIKGPQG